MTTEVSELITRLRMVDETRAGLEAANANLRKVAETAGKAEQGVADLGQGVQATDRQFTAAGRSIGAVVRSIDGTATAAAAASRVLRQHADAVEKLRLQHEREGRSAAETAEALRRLDMVRDAGLAKARAAGARIEAQFISQADATRAGADQLGRFGSVSEQVQRAAESMSSRLGVAGVALSAMGAGGAAAAAALGGLGVALTAIARSGDEAVATLGRLQAVTGSAAAARDVYQRLFEASQRTGVAVAEAAGTFSRFQIAAGEIGATREQVLRLVEGLQKVAIVSGASGQEGGAAMQQLGQALAAGKLNGDELRSVMENMPSLAQALAKELGTNIGQLRKMGEEGQLTADRVFPALLKATERMSADFDKLPLTMSRSFDILGAAMLDFTAKLDEALGTSVLIAKAAKAAADAVNRVRETVLPTPAETAAKDVAEGQSRLANLRTRIAGAEQDVARYEAAGLTRQQALQLALPSAPGAKSIAQEMAEAEDILRRGLQAQYELRTDAAEQANRSSEEAARKATESARTRASAEQQAHQVKYDKMAALDKEYAERRKVIEESARTGATIKDYSTGREVAFDAAAERLKADQWYAKERKKLLDEAARDDDKAERKAEVSAAREAKARDTVLDKLRTELDGRQRLAAAQGMGTEAQAALNTELEIETRLREAGIPIAGRRTAEEERYAGQIEETVRAIDRLKRAEKEGADARAESARESERATREIESQSRRVADDVATSIYEGLVERRRGQGVLDWFGNLFKRIAIQAASTQIFLPITTGIIGSIPQLFGIGTAAASGGSSLLSGLGQLTGLSNLLPSGGLGGMFSGLLSTQVIGGAPAGISVAGGGSLAAGAIPGASIGGATLGQLFGGVGAGFGAGMLLNSVLGGNQTGGMVGSGLGAVGGAILGSFVPVIGPLLGGLLGGAAGGGLGGLFGPGESVRGYGLRLQSNAYNPATGGTTDFGTGLLPIDRTFYDEMGAAVFAQAEQQVAATNAYLASRGLRVAGASIIGGNKDGADYSWADAGSVGEGFSRLRFAATDNAELDARLRLRNFQGVEGLAAFVDGFTQVQTLIKSMAGETVPAFTQQLKAINDNFDSVAAQARAYGLAEASLTEARAKALAALEAQRTETLRQSDVALSLRRMAAAGGGMEMDLAQQAENARQELRSFGEQLDALALTAADKAARLVQLEEVQAAERAAIIRRYGEEAAAALRAAGGNIRQYLDRLATGGMGGMSSADSMASAQSIFARDLTLARGGDRDALGRVTQSADTLLNLGREMYASSPEYQALRSFVSSNLADLPAAQSYEQEMLQAIRNLGGGITVSVDIEAVRVITEQINALPDSDRARLVQAGTVVRTVQESLGRLLQPSERDALIVSQIVRRDIAQAMQRDLTQAERAGLVRSADVLRSIQQSLGRDLTLTERASLVQDALVQRSVQQTIGRDLTAAERAGLVTGADVVRSIQQLIGRDLTQTERDRLVMGASVERTIAQVLSRDLTQVERAGLLQAALIQRTVEQRLGRQLTAAEQASIIESGSVTRGISQTILPPTGTIVVPENEAVMRGIWQQIMAATGAALLTEETVTRVVRQAVETTETIAISRSIDNSLKSLLQLIEWHLRGIKTELAPNATIYTPPPDIRDPGFGGEGGGGSFAKGGVFFGGNVVPFARGGLPELVNSPTLAPMALFGEAGPEAIMPLARGSDGRLGVQAVSLAPMPAGRSMDDLIERIDRLEAVLRELVVAQMTLDRDGMQEVAGEVRALRRPLERVASR